MSGNGRPCLCLTPAIGPQCLIPAILATMSDACELGLRIGPLCLTGLLDLIFVPFPVSTLRFSYSLPHHLLVIKEHIIPVTRGIWGFRAWRLGGLRDWRFGGLRNWRFGGLRLEGLMAWGMGAWVIFSWGPWGLGGLGAWDLGALGLGCSTSHSGVASRHMTGSRSPFLKSGHVLVSS